MGSECYNTPYMKKTKLFVEAVPLVDHQISGVPHAVAGMVAALAANKIMQEQFEIVLVAPGSRMHLLDRWKGLEGCTRKSVPMKFRIMTGLARRNLLPPMDLILGKGIYLFGNYFSWALTNRSRSFNIVHDIGYAVHPELVQPQNQRMLQKNMPRFVRQSDYIIAVANVARQDIIDYLKVDPDRVLTVYNGVDTKLFRHYPLAEVAEVQAKYGLKGQKYFMFVGNIEPRKNLQRLVEALMKLPKDYALLMVGSDGWLNEKVFLAMDQARKAGYTVIKPKTYVPDEEVAKLMSGAVATTFPSIYEGFGLPAAEGLAAQVPLVAGDIPSLREVAGDAAFYCDPYSVDAIAAAMRQAAELTPNQRKLKTSQGLSQIKQFNWEKSAEKLAAKLVEVAKELR